MVANAQQIFSHIETTHRVFTNRIILFHILQCNRLHKAHSSYTSSMSNYASPKSNRSRQLIGIAAVVILHAFLFYAINSGLAKKFVKIVKGPVEAKLIEDAKPDLPPPPPPPPPPEKNVPPPPPPAYVPPVEVQNSAPASVNAIAAVTTAPPVVVPPPAPTIPTPVPTPQVAAPPPPPLVRVAATTQCPQPEYPSASRREEEEGVVVLRLTIEADGTVVDSSIEKSSGFARLDEAARKTVIRCKTKSATVDGKPEKGSARASFTFRLE